MPTNALITSNDRNSQWFMDLCAAVYKKQGLSPEQARFVNERGDELQAGLRELLARLSVTDDEYVHEEVASAWGYPDEYSGPLPIGEQIDKLATMFSLSLGETMKFVETVLPTLELPSGAEGWFAVPSVEALAARHFKTVTNPRERYYQAVLLMIKKLAASRRFYNYRERDVTPDRLRQHARTVAMLERIAETQNGDILVIPSQFGLRHRGRSVRRDWVVFGKNEFGHGALNVGSMLLTHPTRLARCEQLHIDCAGDEFASKADGVFSSAPVFLFGESLVEFGTSPVDSASARFGSSSGFLPQ